LSEAGIRTLPASRSDEALEICADWGHRIDMLIVNPQIEGCREVVEQNPRAKVMTIGAAGKLASHGTLLRPEGQGPPAADRYVTAVQDVLSQRRPC
jgi:hypothetical protein